MEKIKEKNKLFYQTIFLAFMIGVFFQIIGSTILFFQVGLSQINIFGGAVGHIVVISFLLFLFFVFAFRFPWLLNIKDKSVINFFEKALVFMLLLILLEVIVLIVVFLRYAKYIGGLG